MIHDHRPDTLTPRLKEIRDFHSAAPELLAAAVVRDPQLGQLTRHALREIHHYHCPIGIRHERAWIFVIAQKLETPNKIMAHWSLQKSVRDKWQRQFEAAILKTLGVASWKYLAQLGRLPACAEPMQMQIVRLVKSTAEFIRDGDNLSFSRKGAQDAIKKCGLVHDDKMSKLTVHPTKQEVAPNGHALTVFLLWPADPTHHHLF